MKQLTIILTLLLTLTGAVQAQPSLEDANAAYRAEQYTEAAVLYQNILDSCEMPRRSQALVYYNLGNAQFKSGELAQAILAYERSLRLNPTSRDTRYNLAFAESRIVDNIVDNQAFFLVTWLQFIRNLLTESTWLWLSLIAFILLVAAILIFLLSHDIAWRKTAFGVTIVAVIVTVVGFANALSLHRRDALRAEAIITNGIVVAKASPDRSGTELFTLHEGTKVTIHETVGSWVNVQVANNIGWLPASTLERI